MTKSGSMLPNCTARHGLDRHSRRKHYLHSKRKVSCHKAMAGQRIVFYLVILLHLGVRNPHKSTGPYKWDWIYKTYTLRVSTYM